MIYILIEEGYEENNRAKKIIDGILSAARKRHEEIAIYKSPTELPHDAVVAILISQSLRWVSETVARLGDRGIHPLTFGFEQLDTSYKYSCISPSYTRSAYRLTKHILSEGAGKCAILGYNGDSLPDRLKYAGIKQAITEAGAEYTVFKNNGNLGECLESFAAGCGDIESIICCNGNIAVALYTKYRHLLEGRKMCSCSALKICEFFENPYPMCRIDYFAAGTELVRLYSFLKKEGGTNSCIMSVDMDISIGDEDIRQKNTSAEDNEVDFWGDESLKNMERLDRMLMECDDTDVAVLSGVTKGLTYERIAEVLYLSVNTVKYRVKKMLENAGAETRKELLSLISEYRIKL